MGVIAGACVAAAAAVVLAVLFVAHQRGAVCRRKPHPLFGETSTDPDPRLPPSPPGDLASPILYPNPLYTSADGDPHAATSALYDTSDASTPLALYGMSSSPVYAPSTAVTPAPAVTATHYGAPVPVRLATAELTHYGLAAAPVAAGGWMLANPAFKPHMESDS